MAKYIKGETTHSVIVDPNASYTAFGSGNPLPVETLGDSKTKPIGSDSNINVLGGTGTNFSSTINFIYHND